MSVLDRIREYIAWRRNGSQTFECAYCHGVFRKGWSDEEAEAEAQMAWSDEDRAEGEVEMCDHCFQEFGNWMVEG